MANFRFMKWCREAVSRIVLPRDRTPVEQELMGHLEDRYDYFRQLGYSPEDAELRALDSMGNPDEIAVELGRIHRPFWGRTAKVTRIVLIAVVIATVFTAFASLLKHYYFRHTFSNPTYEYYDPYSLEKANYKVGHGDRQFYAQPEVSFSSDGYTVTVTEAALWRNEQRNSAGIVEETHPLYLQLTVTTPLIWLEADTVSRWIWAEDDRGNRYAPPFESGPDATRILDKSYRVNPWTSVHELVIWDLDAPDARWMELHYDRSGRNHTLRIDLTGGQDA